MSSPAPIERYRNLLAERQATEQRWSRLEFRVSLLRLAVMVAIFAVAWFAVQQQVYSLGWVAAPIGLFLALISWHERLLQRKQRAGQAAAFYQQAIDRLEERWREASCDDGGRYAEAKHLYAEDLDVLGRGSLYHLLNRTRTRSGEERLASWLLQPAPIEEVQARQVAVAELIDAEALREDMATLGGEVRSQLEPERLVAWASAEPQLAGLQWVRWLLAGAALANVALIVSWLIGLVGGRPLLFSLSASFVLFLWLRTRIGRVVEGVERSGRDLEVVAELMDRLQAESFEAPWLSERAEALRLGGARPGVEIRRLQSWVQRLESRRNAFFAPFGALVLWTTQIAFVVERWRERWGDRVARWLDVAGDLEAAACLATFGYERGLGEPNGVVFPELLDGDTAHFEAAALGHPLIDPQVCVRNDITLAIGSSAPQAMVISGSNMSGKSTFLRSCGLNVILAWCGAPVVAESLRTSRLAVGASIRIQDSLMEGSSKFYAEIQRLRSILDLARTDGQSLCLLDEILHGTNSHDRRIGAAAVVRALLAEDALVMVTTHDLVLARLTEEEDFAEGASRAGRGQAIENTHFIDTIQDGKVQFDYRLRPGVVTRSNALQLMREVGLDV